MKGTVKFFDNVKGWGFIADESGNDVFVHFSSIQIIDGRKSLHEDDIVEFEIGETTDGRKQAVNVQPILTLQMIEKALKEEGIHVKEVRDHYGLKYIVTNIKGMPFEELAAYAGFSVSEK